MGAFEIRHDGGDRFVLHVRGHEVAFDQPTEDGGADSAPAPTEVFAGSLAACVGFFAERYLRRNGLPLDGLAVHGSFEMTHERPARITRIVLRVVVSPDVPQARLAALQRVVEHCTVHESITHEPQIIISLDGAAAPGRRTA